MKVCKECGKKKSLSKFYKRGSGRPYSRCKGCYNRWTYTKQGKRYVKGRGRSRRNSRDYLKLYVRKGYVKKPSRCERCKKRLPRRRIEGHHGNGYENPLDVTWVCRGCHVEIHRAG